MCVCGGGSHKRYNLTIDLKDLYYHHTYLGFYWGKEEILTFMLLYLKFKDKLAKVSCL